MYSLEKLQEKISITTLVNDFYSVLKLIQPRCWTNLIKPIGRFELSVV